jgi:hypothetical protein
VKHVPYLSSVSVLAALLGLGQMVGCSEEPTDSSSSGQHLSQAEKDAMKADKNKKDISACHLDDGTVDPKDTDLRACAPGDTKKTTICHVPPGNPANAHTLCIGNAAVPHHLANHPDYLGPCKPDIPCPPTTPPPGPPPGGGGGGAGGGGMGGGDMATGGSTGGGGATGGSPGGSGTGGALIP